MVSDVHNIREIDIHMLHSFFFTFIDRFNVSIFLQAHSTGFGHLCINLFPQSSLCALEDYLWKRT